MDEPALVERVHRRFLEVAGCDIITTNSYQASVEGFLGAGYSEEQARAYLRRSVDLAQRAVRDYYDHTEQPQSSSSRPPRIRRPLVAASCGCYGAYLANGSEYTGDYGPSVTVDELMAFHGRRVRDMMMGSQASTSATTSSTSPPPPPPDLLAFETIPNRMEFEAILRLLRASTTISTTNDAEEEEEEEEEPIHAMPPAWISLACRDERSLSSGEPLTDVLQAMIAEQLLPSSSSSSSPSSSSAPDHHHQNHHMNHHPLVAVGINCTRPRHARHLVETLRQHVPAASMAILCYPNRGELWDARTRRWLPDDDDRDDDDRDDDDRDEEDDQKEDTTAATATAAVQRRFVSCMEDCYRAGATIVGGMLGVGGGGMLTENTHAGCCRVTAEDILLLKQRLLLHATTYQ